MAKPIVFVWELKGLDKLADRTDELRKKIELKCDEFAERLGALGVRIASMYYDQAPYAGTNDVTVHLEPGSKTGTVEIVAEGEAVLFIEFGTGVMNADSGEARRELVSGDVVRHGEYGLGLANDPFGWWYTGDMPSNPPTGTTKAYGKSHTIHTYGQAAFPAMYMTRRDLIDNIESIAREVFK